MLIELTDIALENVQVMVTYQNEFFRMIGGIDGL